MRAALYVGIGVGLAVGLRAMLTARRQAALREFCDESWLARVRRASRT